jgi:hypothetical protein
MTSSGFGGNDCWDEDDGLTTHLKKVSDPTNVKHLLQVTNIGKLHLLSRKFFFGSVSRKTYLCKIIGDILACESSRKKFQYTLSSYTQINFQYDHTVQEKSHKRNRIELVDEEENVVLFSVPTDKDMARWENSIRAVMEVGKCYSTLIDKKGRLRPYLHGLHNSTSKIKFVNNGGDGGVKGGNNSGNSSIGGCKTTTVRVVKVHLPNSLGTLSVRLKKSSLETKVIDLKSIIFHQLKLMKIRLMKDANGNVNVDGGGGSSAITNGGEKRDNVIKQADANNGEDVFLEKEQFLNPLTMMERLSSNTEITFQNINDTSSILNNDPSRLPNQVMNPLSCMEIEAKAEEISEISVASETTINNKNDKTNYLLPTQILAKNELDSVSDLLRRGSSAYILCRYARNDNIEERDVWIFDETKTIESLGVTNDGILSVSLRGEFFFLVFRPLNSIFVI